MRSRRAVAATRINLLRATRRLERLRKGAALLRRKREALVSELFKLARPATEARAAIAERTRRAYPALLGALAHHGAADLRALGWPSRALEVETEGGSVWGIAVARITSRPPITRTLGARGTAPGFTSPAAFAATAAFEQLTELLLDAAPREMLIRRLGAALAQTSRQVNLLEKRITPALGRQVRDVRGALEEREREEHLRVKHISRRVR